MLIFTIEPDIFLYSDVRPRHSSGERGNGNEERLAGHDRRAGTVFVVRRCRGDAFRFVAPEADEYSLFPANESGGMIQLEPEGVTLLCCLASIGGAF